MSGFNSIATGLLPILIASSVYCAAGSDYFPPPESKTGWRKNIDPDFVRSLGLDSAMLEEFGKYNLSLHSHSGIKGCIVIKDGWIVGEWYEGPDAQTFINYISSNGKAWAMFLFGILASEDARLNAESKLYDPRWLPEGFPLSDPRKSEITFENIFQHTSGILPESVGDTRQGEDWDFQMYTVGRDANYPESASLCFDPGSKSDYGSVPYNHLTLVFRNATGMLAKDYLWKKILEPIGFGEVSYMHPTGMGDYYWACSGQTGPRMTTRDYARLAYLMLKEGRWDDKQVFPASWLKKFTALPYPNIRSNVDGYFGSQYPADMFRTGGSGMNWAYVIPSLNLVAVRTSRCYESWDEHRPIFLEKLFASVLPDSVSHGEKKVLKSKKIQLFGIFEKLCSASGDYSNPYTDVEATAKFIRPDGSEWNIPLFWDGKSTWKARVSPDAVGNWSFRISSPDLGLDGVSGEFECIDSSLHGGIMPMDGFPYHFQYQDGTPLWFMGDTGWRSFADNAEKNLNRDTVCHYIDVRSEQRFNYIHADMMSGGGIDGGRPIFHDMSKEAINPTFFQEVDYRIQHMNSRDITCGIVLGWPRGNPSWDGFTSEDACLRYARYVTARYSAYNVVLLVAGEWDLGGDESRRELFRAVGREIMKHDPHNRMRSIHAGGKCTVEEFAEEDWMSFGDYQQIYNAPDQREANADERKALRASLLDVRIHNKPVVNSEYAYYLRQMGTDHSYHSNAIDGVDKPHSHTRSSFRRASWVLAMAGGYFVTGFGTTYFGGWRDLGPFDVDAPKNDEAEADLTRISEFFTSLEWWKLEPTDSLAAGDKEGYCYCLSHTDNTYVVYTEGTTSVNLHLKDDSPGEYSVRRFDPRSGEYAELPDCSSSGSVHLTAPNPEDWVFLMERK